MVLYILITLTIIVLFGLGVYLYITKCDKTYKAIKERKEKKEQEEREELLRLVAERNEAKRLKEQAEKEYEEARRKQVEEYRKAEEEFRKPIYRELKNDATGKIYKEVRYRQINDLPEKGEEGVFYLVDHMTIYDKHIEYIDVFIYDRDPFSQMLGYHKVLRVDNLDGYQLFVDTNLNK